MSICLIAQSDYQIDPRVRRKAEALVAAGYTVDVLALRAPDGRKTYTMNGVQVRTISLGKKRGTLARYLFEYAAFFLWTFVRVPIQMLRRRYAVIDVNTLPDFLIFAPILGRLMGASLVLDMHEITPEFYMSKYGVNERSAVIRFLTWQERVSFNAADHVLTVNEPIQDLLCARGLAPVKSTVIMNAADESRFTTRDSAPREGNDVSTTSQFVMVYHGTLTRIYGLDIAIEAFRLAQNEMPGAELWILGSGTETAALASLVAQYGLGSRVKLLGQVPPARIPGILQRCTVGVLPIRRDVFLDFAFPNKLPELIIMDKPVIISRLRAIRRYFSEEAVAYFEPNDPRDLARQMVALYADVETRNRLIRRAKQEYSSIRWDVMKREYLNVVEHLFGQKRQGERSQPGQPAGRVA